MSTNYSKEVQKALAKVKANVGDTILLKRGSRHYQGVLMPRIEFGDPSSVVLKLSSGYNIGVSYGKGISIKKLKPAEKAKKPPLQKQKADPTKPKVSIIATGGTIASKVDYRTGGVIPIISSEELIESIPELKTIANINARIVLSMFSEDMQFAHHQIIAREVAKEIKNGADGVVVTHGTDTMHYSSAMLSFMLQNLPVPVVFVGSQRSSDRGSSDAAINLIAACRFAANANASGVFVCMHENESDKSCLVHSGVSVRKMHTSRRDTFRSINRYPVARVQENGFIELISEAQPRDKSRKLELKDKYDEKVALLKVTPNIDPDIVSFFLKKGYRGLVLEGTGLGHASINKLDKITERNKKLFEALKKASKKMVIGMASQCVYGRVDMNLYSTGRDLQGIGIVPCEMLPEVAFAKLSWALGNYKASQAKGLLRKNIAGEIPDRITNFLA